MSRQASTASDLKGYGSIAVVCTVVAALLLLSAASRGADTEEWQLLYEERGISVSRLDTSPPTFKAEGRVAGNVFEVLAVLADVPRWTDWIGTLEETRIVEGKPEARLVLHNRFDLPWPARNRDSVLESITRSDYATREVAVTFRNIHHAAVAVDPDYVRIPETRGRFLVRDLDGETIFISYTVAIDPGGWLPQWLSDLIVRSIPSRTLAALQRQVKATAGQYDDFIALHRRRAESASQQ